MDGTASRSVKGFGPDPYVLAGSFAANGTSDPALASSRYPRGFPFSVVRSATGTFAVTTPAGFTLPALPHSIVLTPNPTTASDYFDANVIGDGTLNTATRTFTVLTHRGGTALDPTGRVGFAIHCDNSTGK